MFNSADVALIRSVMVSSNTVSRKWAKLASGLAPTMSLSEVLKSTAPESKKFEGELKTIFLSTMNKKIREWHGMAPKARKGICSSDKNGGIISGASLGIELKDVCKDVCKEDEKQRTPEGKIGYTQKGWVKWANQQATSMVGVIRRYLLDAMGYESPKKSKSLTENLDEKENANSDKSPLGKALTCATQLRKLIEAFDGEYQGSISTLLRSVDKSITMLSSSEVTN